MLLIQQVLKQKKKFKYVKIIYFLNFYQLFQFTNEEIIFNDDVIEHIINNYTNKEEGVRNLKRCIETLISKINIYNLSKTTEKCEEEIDLTFTIKDFKLPLKITTEIINILLKTKELNGPPNHMYM